MDQLLNAFGERVDIENCEGISDAYQAVVEKEVAGEVLRVVSDKVVAEGATAVKKNRCYKISA